MTVSQKWHFETHIMVAGLFIMSMISAEGFSAK